jgi:5-methylcytosine-specific restriction endonuclease McrA
MNQDLRAAVFNRDRYCLKCGRPLQDPVAVHHRKLRKHGGTDCLSNLIALCSPCHNIAPNSVHQNPRDSYERGYLVKSWDDPTTAPVTLPNGRRVLLTTDGQYAHLDNDEGNVNGW